MTAGTIEIRITQGWAAIFPDYLRFVTWGSSYWEVGSGWESIIWDNVIEEPTSINGFRKAIPEQKIYTEDQWREAFPNNMPALWENERQAGMRLVDAEQRQGDKLERLIEFTPEGWHGHGPERLELKRK